MTSTVRTLGDALSSGRLRRALVAFQAFNMAEWACWIAVLVWAYDRGGVSAASLVSVVQLVPGVVVAPFASGLGDRLPRGRALALGYALQGAAMIGTGALLAAGSGVAAVSTAAAVLTSAVTLTRPVHNAVLPALARTPGELVAGNAVSSTAEGAGAFLGPLLSGLLIVRGGPEVVLLAFGLLMLAAAVSVVGLDTGAAAARDSEQGTLRGALEGLRELRAEPAAAVLVGMVAGQYVVVGAMDILLLVLALDVLGTDSSGPGLLGSALGIGGIVGGLLTVLLIGRARLGPALAGGLLGTGVPLALLPLTGLAFPVALLLALSGASKAFFDVAARTLLQRVVPDRVLARVFGVQESAMTAAIAVGAALAPAGVGVLGRSGALVAVGALLPLAGVLTWRWLRRLDRLAPAVGPHLDVLRRVPMLRLASPPVLEQLARHAAEELVPAGTVVMREGEPGDRFAVVVDGLLSVSRHGHEVRQLGPGDAFGEIALLHGTTRTATVTASRPARLVTLDRAHFLRAIGSDGARAEAEHVVRSYLAADEQTDAADDYPGDEPAS